MTVIFSLIANLCKNLYYYNCHWLFKHVNYDDVWSHMCILIGHTCVFYMSTISQVTLCIPDNYQINIFQFSLVKVATEANIIMFQYLDSLEVWKLGHTTKESGKFIRVVLFIPTARTLS